MSNNHHNENMHNELIQVIKSVIMDTFSESSCSSDSGYYEYLHTMKFDDDDYCAAFMFV